MPRARVGFRGFAPLLALIALVLALQDSNVSAGITWCRADPVVSLNGTQVQILVGIPAEYQYLVDGPILVTIKTPREVDDELLWTDTGFNEYGELVRFGSIRGDIAPDGSFPVTIQVTVPASGRFNIPMRVDVISDNGNAVAAEGRNGGVTIRTRIVGSW